MFSQENVERWARYFGSCYIIGYVVGITLGELIGMVYILIEAFT